MRLVCVDLPSTDDDVVAAAVDRARGLAAHDGRILLFAHAARLSSRRHREARTQREGAWLAASADWLLDDGDVGAPPVRPVADLFDERAVAVVTSRTEALSLPATDRFLELVEGLLVMAVPGEEGVDAVDNAHLWLIGGASFAVESRPGGRGLVRVGGRIVVVEIGRGEALVHAYPLAGGEAVTHVVALVPSAKMAVRGGR
jgi:hypothetical protein